MKSAVRGVVALAACCLLVSSSCSSAWAARSITDRVSDITGVKDWCINQKVPIDCDLRDECVWCINPNSKIGARCYPTTVAKMFPKSWNVQCDKELHQQPEADHTAAGDNATCDKLPQASCLAPACVWCTSAAVGGGCFTPEEAKLLPKAIFKCNVTPSLGQ